MTSETNQPIQTPVFQPIEPAPPVEAVSAGPTTPSRRTRTIVNGVLAAAFVVLVGGVAFAAGRATAPAATTAGGTSPLPGDPGDGRFGPGSGGLSIQGTVTAVDGDSITFELADGGTIKIALDSDTDYHRQADASASDVTTGMTVIVGLDGLRGANEIGATDVTIVP